MISKISKICKSEVEFPSMLIEHTPDINAIYYKGNIELVNMPCISVVGSRKCTAYGMTVAREIGRKAAEYGVCVVSGLAKGIDTAAHKGALEAGGKTIAVIGGGIDTYYPKENRELQEKIERDGLVISLKPPGYQVRYYDFPIRNRIISALALSVVVVEAAIRSGALITCECAAEMGKEIYAVPGNITSHYSFGCNQLIRENVTPLVLIDDLFTDLGLDLRYTEKEKELLSDREKLVYSVIQKSGEITIDQVRVKTGLDSAEISGIMTILEMKGLIFSSLGKFFVAKF